MKLLHAAQAAHLLFFTFLLIYGPSIAQPLQQESKLKSSEIKQNLLGKRLTGMYPGENPSLDTPWEKCIDQFANVSWTIEGKTVFSKMEVTDDDVACFVSAHTKNCFEVYMMKRKVIFRNSKGLLEAEVAEEGPHLCEASWLGS